MNDPVTTEFVAGFFCFMAIFCASFFRLFFETQAPIIISTEQAKGKEVS